MGRNPRQFDASALKDRWRLARICGRRGRPVARFTEPPPNAPAGRLRDRISAIWRIPFNSARSYPSDSTPPSSFSAQIHFPVPLCASTSLGGILLRFIVLIRPSGLPLRAVCLGQFEDRVLGYLSRGFQIHLAGLSSASPPVPPAAAGSGYLARFSFHERHPRFSWIWLLPSMPICCATTRVTVLSLLAPGRQTPVSVWRTVALRLSAWSGVSASVVRISVGKVSAASCLTVWSSLAGTW